MSGSAPMRRLLAIGHRPHSIDRRKYGQPYVALYWANRRDFTHPGLHAWLWSRNVRLVPVRPRMREVTVPFHGGYLTVRSGAAQRQIAEALAAVAREDRP